MMLIRFCHLSVCGWLPKLIRVLSLHRQKVAEKWNGFRVHVGVLCFMWGKMQGLKRVAANGIVITQKLSYVNIIHTHKENSHYTL